MTGIVGAEAVLAGVEARDINKPIAVQDRVRVVMAMLRDAAATDAPCPTNLEICAKLGLQTPSMASNIIALLETMALIAVERTNNERRVTILSTGQSTAVIAGKVGAKPRRRFPKGVLYVFDDALADGLSIADAAQRAGLTEQQGDLAFAQISAALGVQAA